jgi:hypothetical protein
MDSAPNTAAMARSASGSALIGALGLRFYGVMVSKGSVFKGYALG